MDFFLRSAEVVAADRHRRLLIEAERERLVAGRIPRPWMVAIRERAVARAVGAVLGTVASAASAPHRQGSRSWTSRSSSSP